MDIMIGTLIGAIVLFGGAAFIYNPRQWGIDAEPWRPSLAGVAVLGAVVAALILVVLQ